MASEIVCGDSGCGITIAEFDGYSLIVRSRHHGRPHTSTVQLSELVDTGKKIPAKTKVE